VGGELSRELLGFRAGSKRVFALLAILTVSDGVGLYCVLALDDGCMISLFSRKVSILGHAADLRFILRFCSELLTSRSA
jgi:hypothetical protein